MTRRNLSATPATLLLAFSGGMACLVGSWRLQASSLLSAGEALGWAAAGLIAGALVLARGHEKKLYGSYRSQERWMMLNQATLQEKYLRASNQGRTPTDEATPARAKGRGLSGGSPAEHSHDGHEAGVRVAPGHFSRTTDALQQAK